MAPGCRHTGLTFPGRAPSSVHSGRRRLTLNPAQHRPPRMPSFGPVFRCQRGLLQTLLPCREGRGDKAPARAVTIRLGAPRGQGLLRPSDVWGAGACSLRAGGPASVLRLGFPSYGGGPADGAPWESVSRARSVLESPRGGGILTNKNGLRRALQGDKDTGQLAKARARPLPALPATG